MAHVKALIYVLAALLLAGCQPSPQSLETRVQTIELSYIAWACDCANWATSEDINRYADNYGDSLAQLCIFVEPGESSLVLPDTIGYNNDLVRFTGSFYEKAGFPKGYRSEEHADKGRVFRYTKFEVVKSNYRSAKVR